MEVSTYGIWSNNTDNTMMIQRDIRRMAAIDNIYMLILVSNNKNKRYSDESRRMSKLVSRADLDSGEYTHRQGLLQHVLVLLVHPARDRRDPGLDRYSQLHQDPA